MWLQNRLGAAPGEGIPGEEVMFWIIRLMGHFNR